MSRKCYAVKMIHFAEDRQVYPDRTGITTRLGFEVDGRELLFRELRVGAMWLDDQGGICVKLPGSSNGLIWRMNEMGTDGHSTWKISGDIPNVTATPSINCTGLYHGCVRDGEVTDDCDGRKFDDFGKRTDQPAI